MKTSNLSSSSLASSSLKATPSSSWGLSVVSARRRATLSSKSGHTSTRSGTARSPRGGFLKTQRHTLLRFIVVGFERSVSVRRAGAYNVSVLPFTPYSPKCLEGEFCELRHNGVLRSSQARSSRKFRCSIVHSPGPMGQDLSRLDPLQEMCSLEDARCLPMRHHARRGKGNLVAR